MATISQARNLIFPAMPHHVLRVLLSLAALCSCIRLPHTMAPALHCRLLKCSLLCVSVFKAKQGGAGSGFPRLFPSRRNVKSLVVGSRRLLLPRWAGFLVNRKKVLGSKQLELGPPKR